MADGHNHRIFHHWGSITEQSNWSPDPILGTKQENKFLVCSKAAESKQTKLYTLYTLIVPHPVECYLLLTQKNK